MALESACRCVVLLSRQVNLIVWVVTLSWLFSSSDSIRDTSMRSASFVAHDLCHSCVEYFAHPLGLVTGAAAAAVRSSALGRSLQHVSIRRRLLKFVCQFCHWWVARHHHRWYICCSCRGAGSRDTDRSPITLSPESDFSKDQRPKPENTKEFGCRDVFAHLSCDGIHPVPRDVEAHSWQPLGIPARMSPFRLLLAATRSPALAGYATLLPAGRDRIFERTLSV